MKGQRRTPRDENDDNLKLLKEQYHKQVNAAQEKEDRVLSKTHKKKRYQLHSRINERCGVLTRDSMGYFTDNENPLTSMALPTPGPGSYAPALQRVGPQFSILGKPKAEIPPVGPSPMKYKIPDTTSSIAFTLGGRPSRSYFDKSDVVPAPNTYTADKKEFGSDAKAFSIGVRRDMKADEMPGPGEYSVPRESSTASAKTFGIRPSDDMSIHTAMVVVGPGDYDANVGMRATHNAAQAFTMRPRLEPRECEEITPGPGAYLVPGTIQCTNKAASIKSRHPDPKKMVGPGPATYAPSIAPLFSGPQFSMTSAIEPDYDWRHNPGPTKYSPNIDAMKNVSPIFTLGMRTRPSFPVLLCYPEDSCTGVPGPGSYDADDAPVRDRAVAHTILVQRNQRPPKGPGPADYDVVRARDVWHRSPAFTIGSRPVSRAATAPTAGPATYNPKVKWGGPKYSLAQRKCLDFDNGVPAPNAYKVNAAKKQVSTAASFKGRASPFVYSGYRPHSTHSTLMTM